MEIQVYRGYWMVEWFKREFGHPRGRPRPRRGMRARGPLRRPRRGGAAGLDGAHPPAVLVARACAIPGPEAKGAIIGFGDVHTRAHLYRAILEGLAYALRDGAERTAKRTGVPLTSLRIAGGGSQSPAAVQLTADVFGLPVARAHTHEASGLGAAIDAAVGLGLHRDVATAAGRWSASARSATRTPPRTGSTTSCTAASTGGCTAGCGRSTGRSAGSPDYPPR